VQPFPPGVWELTRAQHGVIARRQLLQLGYSARAVEHRLESGRLHRMHTGVYAVGRPALTRRGAWMAAILACGPDALLSHASAAELLSLRPSSGAIEVSVPAGTNPRRPGLTVHRRSTWSAAEATRRHGIPVTSCACTIVDLAPRLSRDELEATIGAADRLGLIDPEALRAGLDGFAGRPGAAIVRRTLDRRTFRITDSRLERRFLALVRGASLPLPDTARRMNGFRVDFFWDELGLVVETDGLQYHRTAAQQAKDIARDHANAARGLTPLRFTHGQVRYEPAHVVETLSAIMRRLARG
jgi:very-short-patch-repair endonuclease